MLTKFLIDLHKNGVVYLRVKVLPKSPQNKIVEILVDETIKIRIQAAPEKGRANQALIKFLSQEFNVSAKNVTIISGQTTPVKLIKVIK